MASRQFSNRRADITSRSTDTSGIVSELKVLAMAMTGAGTVEPVPGWLYCNGAAVSRTTYEALFAAIGTAYGVGDGTTTFNLPDYRGRSIIADPDGQTGATRATAATRGTVVGAENVTLSTANLPVHTHTLTGSPTLTGAPSLSGAPALTGAVARSGSLGLTGAPGISDPGHSHTVTIYQGTGWNAAVPWAGEGSGQIGPNTGAPSTAYSSNGSGTGVTATIGTLAVSDGLTVNNGTLAVGVGTLASGIGTLAAGIGTLAASNAGSGTAVPNLHPSQGAGGVVIKY